jgi:outer membrane receptor protein involved in Fe transport
VGGRYDGADGRAATLAAYSTRVRDEIDFDLATLSYANIQRSWHRGIEGLIAWPLPHALSARASGAWTPTTFRGGDSDGKQINGVPVATGFASLGWAPTPKASVDLGARVVGRQFLDKLEEHPLGGFVTWELGIHGSVQRMHGTLRVLNLLDRRTSDTGFIGAFGEERFSPAAPRSVVVSVSLD